MGCTQRVAAHPPRDPDAHSARWHPGRHGAVLALYGLSIAPGWRACLRGRSDSCMLTLPGSAAQGKRPSLIASLGAALILVGTLVRHFACVLTAFRLRSHCLSLVFSLPFFARPCLTLSCCGPQVSAAPQLVPSLFPAAPAPAPADDSGSGGGGGGGTRLHSTPAVARRRNSCVCLSSAPALNNRSLPPGVFTDGLPPPVYWYSVVIFFTAQLFLSSEKVFEEMTFHKYTIDIFYMFFWTLVTQVCSEERRCFRARKPFLDVLLSHLPPPKSPNKPPLRTLEGPEDTLKGHPQGTPSPLRSPKRAGTSLRAHKHS